ncbi:hypothetical protein BV22DRAFT_1019395 [Leucogyrophana mollusca]|uniref:Uncharacterized protein n=1 Tax=Leucogyrophana mollusca TaxID=85980 RepID=A0ACB8B883_9AGAM|nr:hypothetical protein BV22DRAFT_1019395 [Leucogyrophana mollusca]
MSTRNSTRISVTFPPVLPSNNEPRSTLHSMREMPPRTPAPRYRHAAPSGPWPWMDFGSDFGLVHASPPQGITDKSWKGYPQNLFPNWTHDQVKRSKMLSSASNSGESTIHMIDVTEDPSFGDHDAIPVSPENTEQFWELVQETRPHGIRVRALFVDNMSLPVLKMLGTKFNIEPFFFSSSVNWIPSRYQEELRPGIGDHITITLPFIRTMINPTTAPTTPTSEIFQDAFPKAPFTPKVAPPFMDDQQVIDTQASLSLRSTGNILLLDLLAVHMVRTAESSTIISYHPGSTWRRTSAKRLHSLVQRAGQSVYWSKIFDKSDDPTFLLLAILWYALYAWDEAFEVLYTHINWLESRVISTNDIHLTRELHILQAHLLHYTSLLQDFHKSVTFVLLTPNPAMDSPTYDTQKREDSKELMKKECDNLLSEIDRLEGRRAMQSSRLKNVMELAFATVNIEDSKHMRKLTEAAVRDSAAMKQVCISYLTMIFLPASFTAAVFGMNVKEINQGSLETLSHYAETTIALTFVTAWLVVAFQSKSPMHDVEDGDFWTQRLWWPVFYTRRKIRNHWQKGRGEEKESP